MIKMWTDAQQTPCDKSSGPCLAPFFQWRLIHLDSSFVDKIEANLFKKKKKNMECICVQPSHITKVGEGFRFIKLSRSS